MEVLAVSANVLHLTTPSDVLFYPDVQLILLQNVLQVRRMFSSSNHINLSKKKFFFSWKWSKTDFLTQIQIQILIKEFELENQNN